MRGPSKHPNQFSQKVMQPCEAAYVAGFLDGEGTISIWAHGKGVKRSKAYIIHVEASNTNLEILTYLLNATGNGRISPHLKQEKNHKPAWKWQLTPSQVRAVLPQLVPYLQGKKEQAELVVRYYKLQDKGKINGFKGIADRDLDEALSIINTIIELNRRGSRNEGRDFISRKELLEINPKYCVVSGCEQRQYKEHTMCYAHWRKFEEPILKPCAMCGTEMSVLRNNKKFCSKPCMSRFYYLQSKE